MCMTTKLLMTCNDALAMVGRAALMYVHACGELRRVCRDVNPWASNCVGARV